MEEKSKKRFWKGVLTGALGMLLAIAIVIGVLVMSNSFVIGIVPNTSANTSQSGTVPISTAVRSKLDVLETYVKSSFLFDTDEENLANGVYKGYIAALNDPYSEYYTKEEYEEMNESIDGSYYGIGVMEVGGKRS